MRASRESSFFPLACNSYLWGLGPSVLYGAADTLTDPGWQEEAADSVRAVFAKRDEAFLDARRLGIIRCCGPGPRARSTAVAESCG